MTNSVEKSVFYENQYSSGKAADGNIQALPETKPLVLDDHASPSLEKSMIMPLSMASLDSRRSLLLKWIPVLYKGGATPFFVQRHIETLCRVLNLSVNTTYIPGRVLLTWNENSISKSEHNDLLLYQPSTITLRVSWGFRVGMLEKMNNLLDKIEEYADSPRHSIEDLHILVDKATVSLPVYNNWISLAAFSILSGSMAPAFFGGNYYDGLFSLLIGAIAGAFAIGSDYFPSSFLFMHEAVCSFVCSLLSVLVCALVPSANLHYWPIVLASTIWILPGFSMVIGFMDVVTKFTATGFMTHFGAVFVGLTMALGYAISIRFLNICGLEIPSLNFGQGLSSNAMRYILSAIFTAACCVIFQASPKQIPLVIFSVLICFSMMDTFETEPEPLVYGFIAFFMGIIIRSCAKMLNQLPEASIYVAKLPLVPGSKIVRSTFALLDHVHRLKLMSNTETQYLAQINTNRFPQWIESIFVCVVVAIGFVGSDVVFNRIIMPYIVNPFLGPYFLFPFKKNFVIPYISDPLNRFSAHIRNRCCNSGSSDTATTIVATKQGIDIEISSSAIV